MRVAVMNWKSTVTAEVRIAGARVTLGILAVLMALIVASPAEAKSHGKPRSQEAKRAFRVEHPCPATGKITGACKGYVIDHVNPLCAGGPDAPGNMQWQTSEAAKRKDKWERSTCTRAR